MVIIRFMESRMLMVPIITTRGPISVIADGTQSEPVWWSTFTKLNTVISTKNQLQLEGSPPLLEQWKLGVQVSFHQMKEILILHKLADFKTTVARHLRPRIAETSKA
jgi:hypothetical protein